MSNSALLASDGEPTGSCAVCGWERRHFVIITLYSRALIIARALQHFIEKLCCPVQNKMPSRKQQKKAYRKNYYLSNASKLKAAAKSHYEVSPEIKKAASRSLNSVAPDKKKATSRAVYSVNPGQCRKN